MSGSINGLPEGRWAAVIVLSALLIGLMPLRAGDDPALDARLRDLELYVADNPPLLLVIASDDSVSSDPFYAKPGDHDFSPLTRWIRQWEKTNVTLHGKNSAHVVIQAHAKTKDSRVREVKRACQKAGVEAITVTRVP